MPSFSTRLAAWTLDESCNQFPSGVKILSSNDCKNAFEEKKNQSGHLKTTLISEQKQTEALALPIITYVLRTAAFSIDFC